jgi:hypothetical protein
VVVPLPFWSWEDDGGVRAEVMVPLFVYGWKEITKKKGVWVIMDVVDR